MDWRLRDVNVGLQGVKTLCAIFCASLIAGSRRAFLFVDCVSQELADCVCLCRSVRVLTEPEWNTQGANVFSLYENLFYLFFLFLVFRHLKITLDSEQPMLG